MTDRQVICRRLHALEAYVTELERLASTLSRSAFDSEVTSQWMVEHGLQLAIESILDIANHLVAGGRLGAPQSYREALELLGSAEILPGEFVSRLRGMPGFRNILVHDYLAVDLGIVWDMLQTGPAQFREFIRRVAAHLRSLPDP